MIDTVQIRALMDIYGGDVNRWPEGDRDAALAAIARSPDLADALRDAQRLDEALASWPVPPPSANAVAEILMAAERARQVPVARPALWRWGAFAAVAAAALVVGLTPLLMSSRQPVSSEPASTPVEMALQTDAAAWVFTPLEGYGDDELL